MFNDFLGLDKTFYDVVHVIEKPLIFETIAKSNVCTLTAIYKLILI